MMPQSIQLLIGKKIDLYSKILISTMFVALLSGTFSFERIVTSGLNLPVFLLEIRFVLSLFFFVLFLGKSFTLKMAKRKLSGYPLAWCIISSFFFIYMCTTVVWAPTFAGLQSRIPGMLLIIFFIISVPVVFDSNVNERMSFLLCLIAIVSILYVVGGFVTDNLVVGRMSAFGGGPNVFARVVGMGVISSLFLWVRYDEKFWLFLVPLLSAVTLLSGSRGGLLALIIGLFAFVYFILRHRFSSLSMIIPGIAIGTLLLSLNSSISRLIVEMWTVRIYQLTIVEKYTTRRDVVFDTAWRMFQDKPIAGHGLFSFAIKGGTEVEYPHNIFLEAAAEGGGIALVFLCIALVIVFFLFSRLVTWEQRAFWAIGIQYFTASQFSGSLYDTRFMWIFWTICIVTLKNKLLPAKAFNTHVDPKSEFSKPPINHLHNAFNIYRQ